MTAEAGTPLRTLIVDDEPLAIERLQLLCAREPMIDLVATASDGRAALRLSEALEPDLLLLDIAMPELDGIAVARALRAIAPPSSSSPLSTPSRSRRSIWRRSIIC